MNHYTLSELSPGLSAEFSYTVTEEAMELFYRLTGDNSPIHMDAEYAAQRGYENRVMYGMLGASLFSTLAGVYLPGEHCLLHSVECKFAKPVLLGETLTVRGEIAEVNETFREVTIKGTILNAEGKKVTRAVIKASVAK